MPSAWDHRSDKDLLLTIIENGNLVHIDWQSVSATMKSKNYTFSHEACRQHYQKIRKEARNSNGSSFSTPTKPNTSAKSTPASRRNGKGANNHSFSNDDDEELLATPSNKRKRPTPKHEKAEPEDLGGFLGQTAAQFKLEENNSDNYRSPIDLINDGIYAA